MVLASAFQECQGGYWRIRKKKKKKEKVAGAGMGYCPVSKIESQYNRLYCGTQQAEQAHSRLSRHAGLDAPGGGRDMAGHGHDMECKTREIPISGNRAKS